MRIRKPSAATIIAMTALFIALSGTASAAVDGPVWIECGRAAKMVGGHHTGQYNDKLCSEVNGANEGKYEPQAGVGKGLGFRSTAAGITTFHNLVNDRFDVKIECARSKVQMTLEAPNRVRVRFDLHTCLSLGAPCKVGVGPTASIRFELTGTLGWIDASIGAAGVRLALPPIGHTGSFEGECAGLTKFRAYGSANATISPVGAVSATKTLAFAVGPYLGETKIGLTPFVNGPAFEGEEPIEVIHSDVNGPETANVWLDGLVGGIETTVIGQGTPVEIR